VISDVGAHLAAKYPIRPTRIEQDHRQENERAHQQEGLRALHGFAPLGPADGPVKTAIFGGNNAKLYGIQLKRAMLDLSRDRFAAFRAEYDKAGPEPSNLRYGYVVPDGSVDYSKFA
jgi:hypothetical protein